MRLYRWQAVSSGGKAYNGEILAESEKEVIDFIHRNYGYVTEIKTVRESISFYRWFQPRLHFSDRERAVFYKQLATLLEAGIPVAKAAEIVSSGLNESSGPVCRQIAISLQKGQPLSYALSLLPGLFSEMNVSVIEAGEASGQLTYTLRSLAEFYKQQDKLLKFGRNACIYPAFLLFLAFLACIYFSVELIPSFAELYRSLGVKETVLLQTMISFSRLLQDHTVALSCVSLVIGKSLMSQREKIFSLVMRIPALQSLRHPFLEIRFVRLMALMIQSGIAFPEAILRSSVALTDDSMRDKAKTFSEHVLRGIAITEAASMAGDLFSKTGLEFINIGETSGNLPYMLNEYAAIREQELLEKLRDLKTILEPALVVMIAAMVFSAMAVMLSPLFSLMTRLPEYN